MEIEVVASTSLMDSRDLNTPALTTLVYRVDGVVKKDNCYKFLIFVISDIVLFFGEKWTDEQLYACAKLIYENYYYFRISDWAIFCKRAKSSMFGKVYGKLNPNVIMNWAEDFNYEWMKVSIEISEGGNLGRIANPEVTNRLGLK